MNAVRANRWRGPSRPCSRLLIAATAASLVACSAANPLSISAPGGLSGASSEYRGVVNGLWRFDPDENVDRLEGHLTRASADQAAGLADRHQVRVGIDRSLFLGKASEVTVLPEGWTYSMDRVVNDGRTINIGDVVQIRADAGSSIEVLTDIVRKCDQPALPDENPDWDIGCKFVESFGRSGYAGETYFLTAF